MHTLLIKDENVMGETINEFQLDINTIDFNAEKITVADLITARVKSEVAKYQQSADNYCAHFLVTPSKVEARLNDHYDKKPKRARVNVEKQVQLALKAFESNGFFVLFNEEQVENLQQELLMTSQSKVSFIKLTPLVGG